MLAADIMDRARVHLNDVGADIFNNDVLLPFLVSAWEELQSTMQAHGLPIMIETSSAIALPSGVIELGTSAVVPNPTLPANFIEPKAMYERAPGAMQWEPMTEAHGIVESTMQPKLGIWEWTGDYIKFIGSTANREILLRYLKGLPEIKAPPETKQTLPSITTIVSSITWPPYCHKTLISISMPTDTKNMAPNKFFTGVISCSICSP